MGLFRSNFLLFFAALDTQDNVPLPSAALGVVVGELLHFAAVRESRLRERHRRWVNYDETIALHGAGRTPRVPPKTPREV